MAWCAPDRSARQRARASAGVALLVPSCPTAPRAATAARTLWTTCAAMASAKGAPQQPQRQRRLPQPTPVRCQRRLEGGQRPPAAHPDSPSPFPPHPPLLAPLATGLDVTCPEADACHMPSRCVAGDCRMGDNKPVGTACDDGLDATIDDQCDADGVCR